jgi:hypothetical protein
MRFIRRFGLAALGLVAILPLLLCRCARTPETRPTVSTPTASSAPPALVTSAPVETASAVETTESATPSPDAPAEEADEEAGRRELARIRAGASPAQCKAWGDKVEAYIRAHRSCTRDAECELVQTSCGLSGVCGVAVTARDAPGLEAVEKPFDAHTCWVVLAAPCPTCPMPPPVRCVAGKCTP